jgi:hypothetical protein
MEMLLQDIRYACRSNASAEQAKRMTMALGAPPMI